MITNDNPPAPYALWSGPAREPGVLKTGRGVLHWNRDLVACELVHPEATHSVARSGEILQIRTDTYYQDACNERLIQHLKDVGVATLVNAYNHSPLERDFVSLAYDCLAAGINVATGTHAKLSEESDLEPYLDGGYYHPHWGKIYDFRFSNHKYPLGTGRKRTGLRLLTIGPDGVAGKKYAALAIRSMAEKMGVSATFCATGQTGRLLCRPTDRWIVLDAIPVDYSTGAAEWLTPDHEDPGHWYVIEGQANVFHPAWGPDSLALLLGCQPDALVYCAVPGRKQQRSTHKSPIPTLLQDVDDHLRICYRMGFATRLAGISLNPSEATEEEMETWWTELTRLRERHDHLRVPVFNPLLNSGSLDDLVEHMECRSRSARAGAR